MRIAIFNALPFHDGITGFVERALVAAGACHWQRQNDGGDYVLRLTWTPQSAHDWASKHAGKIQAQLREFKPDLIVCADYPYGFLREVAPVVALRHSLASRQNTWHQEQAEADWIVSWSAWDEREFRRRGVLPRRGFLRAGCVWRATDAQVDAARVRSPQPAVLWAPTWNEDLNHRGEVVAALGALEAVRVVVRPHPATVWREPQWIDALKALGFEVDLGDRPLAEAILDADVVVSDCSGAGLGVLLVPEPPPVVWVGGAPTGHAQFDPEGPEWSLRANIGVESATSEIRRSLSSVMLGPRFDTYRRATQRDMLGPWTATHPADRLARMLLTPETTR